MGRCCDRCCADKCVNVCVCLPTCVCEYACLFACVHMCVCLCVNVCVCVCTSMCLCVVQRLGLVMDWQTPKLMDDITVCVCGSEVHKPRVLRQGVCVRACVYVCVWINSSLLCGVSWGCVWRVRGGRWPIGIKV